MRGSEHKSAAYPGDHGGGRKTGGDLGSGILGLGGEALSRAHHLAAHAAPRPNVRNIQQCPTRSHNRPDGQL